MNNNSVISWTSLPLANVLAEDRVVKEIAKGFRYIKEQSKLDDKVKECATNVGNWISEKCPGLLISSDDVLSFQACFMPSSSSSYPLVHAIQVEGGLLNHSGDSTQVIIYICLMRFQALIYRFTNTILV